jgi:hypothetical protein
VDGAQSTTEEPNDQRIRERKEGEGKMKEGGVKKTKKKWRCY